MHNPARQLPLRPSDEVVQANNEQDPTEDQPRNLPGIKCIAVLDWICPEKEREKQTASPEDPDQTENPIAHPRALRRNASPMVVLPNGYSSGNTRQWDGSAVSVTGSPTATWGAGGPATRSNWPNGGKSTR